MSTHKHQKPSEEEADRFAVEQAGDPNAWEEPIFVPPSSSPRPAWALRSKHLDLAAKFYVLSVLHRLGAEANLTFAQPDDVDITVVQESGHVLTIDVKTLAGTTDWHIERLRAKKDHYVVFVCYLDSVQDPAAVPEVYILPSMRLKSLVARTKAESMPLEFLSRETNSRETWRLLTSAPAA